MTVMAATSIARFQTRICLLIAVVVAVSWSGAVVDAKKFNKLVFYLHEPYAEVDLLAASASGNKSTYAFGNLGITEQIIREGISNTSKIIGRAPGTYQPNKEYKTFALYKLLTLQTEEWNGTIVVFSDWDWEAPTNEWTVAGGTGTFRMATGYAINREVDGGSHDSFVTFKWEVYISSLSLLTTSDPGSNA